MSQEDKDKPSVPRRDPDKPNVPDWAKEINPALKDEGDSAGSEQQAAPPSGSKPDVPAPGSEDAKPEPAKPAPAAKKTAPPAAKPAAAGGSGKPAPPAPKPASAAKKPAPRKPKIERREFLNWLSLGWLAFSVASAAGLTAMGRFFFPNVLFEPPSQFKVGFPQDFADGQVDLRFKQKYRVWVIREGGEIYALHAKCTHLGCTPSWLAWRRTRGSAHLSPCKAARRRARVRWR